MCSKEGRRRTGHLTTRHEWIHWPPRRFQRFPKASKMLRKRRSTPSIRYPEPRRGATDLWRWKTPRKSLTYACSSHVFQKENKTNYSKQSETHYLSQCKTMLCGHGTIGTDSPVTNNDLIIVRYWAVGMIPWTKSPILTATWYYGTMYWPWHPWTKANCWCDTIARCFDQFRNQKVNGRSVRSTWNNERLQQRRVEPKNEILADSPTALMPPTAAIPAANKKHQWEIRYINGDR